MIKEISFPLPTINQKSKKSVPINEKRNKWLKLIGKKAENNPYD
jgi:hypothetical protein